MQQMKRNIILKSSWLLLSILMLGCRSNPDRIERALEKEAHHLGVTKEDLVKHMAEAPQLQLDTDDPKLLPAEQTHEVINKITVLPTIINTNDLREISALIGRVPGLWSYEISGMRESYDFPGCYDMRIKGEMVVVVAKQDQWRVRQVHRANIRVRGFEP
jgi:hypothetical protein